MTGAAVNIVPMTGVDLPFERIGHRGAPREFPENTLPSFQRAVERGANAVELDVHATIDGVPVVHHDPIVSRALDPGHAGLPLAAMTWQDVQRIELAPGVFVPSLDQVLELLAGRATIYVEIKGTAIEELVVDTIRRGRAHCAVHSFDHECIARVARIAPELRRGILFDEPPLDVQASMRSADAVDVWPHWPLVNDALVRAVREVGGEIITWTVNTPSAARQLLALGVHGICTDDVRLLSPVAA